MTQQELLGIVAEKIQTSLEKTTDVLDVILNILSEELVENGVVYIDDFGVFETQKRSEYVSLNSKTGERLLMPPAIEIVFESYITDSTEAELDSDTDNVAANNNTIKGYNASEVLSFEPDLSLKNIINNAFINFEPTVLNEGVELSGIEVISDAQEISKSSTFEEVSDQEGKLSSVSDNPLTPNVAADHGPTDESETEIAIPAQITSLVDVKTYHNINESPPIKQRTNISRIWVPIMGGVAITLAALFFFNGTTQKKCKY